MRNFRFASLVCCMLAALFIGSQVPVDVTSAQEKKAEKTAKKAPRKPRGRLPNYYGQVGLSGEQREKIYAVQATYAKEIGALRKQIAELESKRDSEVKAVLTEEQQKKVDELVEAAKKRAEERRKKRSSTKSSS